jgi:hypothetical protein
MHQNKLHLNGASSAPRRLSSRSPHLPFCQSYAQLFRHRTAAILGFNTAEGQNALLHLTGGTANTAVGWFSLKSVTTGSFNTGVGAGTLVPTPVTITRPPARERFKQYHWYLQHGQWSVCPVQQHQRHQQHGHRLWCAVEQHDRRREHGHRS